jgi:hypothetical protein
MIANGEMTILAFVVYVGCAILYIFSGYDQVESGHVYSLLAIVCSVVMAVCHPAFLMAAAIMGLIALLGFLAVEPTPDPCPPADSGER